MTTLPASEPARNNRPLLLIIIGALVGVILIGTGGAALAFNLLNQRPNSIPQLLAADTQVYAAFTPNMSDLPNIERLRRAFPEAFDYERDADTNDGLRELLGVDMAEDVAPWLGAEVAMAVSQVPMDQLPALGADPSELSELPSGQIAFILASRDNQRAAAFLDKQRAHRESQGAQFTSSKAGDVTIYAQNGGERSPIAAFALVGDHVVFASDADLIAGMVERAGSPDGSLQASPHFQAVLAALPADRLGFMYVAGAPVAELLRNSEAQASRTLPADCPCLRQFEQAIEVAEALHGVGFSMAVIESGLRFDATTVVDKAAISSETLAAVSAQAVPVAAERAGQVSDATIGAMSFRIPETLGENIIQTITSMPDGEELLTQYEEALGLDLQADLFDWFHGEAVLAFFPGEADAPVSGYFALAPSDRAAAEAGMEKIISSLEQMFGGDLGLASTEVGGASFQVLETPDGMAGYGFVGNDLVIGFGETALAASGGAGSALADNPAYKTAVAALPAPNTGTFFVDLGAIVKLGRETDNLDAEVAERLAPFKALAAAANPSIDDKGIARFSLMVLIGEE